MPPRVSNSKSVALALSLALAALIWGTAANANSSVLVGAIRWDNWTVDSSHSRTVLDPRSTDRVPFFAFTKRDGETALLGAHENVVDAENAYAYAAGIDYWIFGYYALPGRTEASLRTAERIDSALSTFQRLPSSRGMRFAIELNQPPKFEFMDATVQQLSTFIADQRYLRLDDGTAPLFVFDYKQWEGSNHNSTLSKLHLSDLSHRLEVATKVKIHLVLVSSATTVMPDYILRGPISSFTSYVIPPPNDGRGRSFAECSSLTDNFWSRARATGLPFLPTVTLGWDFRVRNEYPEEMYGSVVTSPSFCSRGSDQDWIDQIRKAVILAGQYPAFRSVILYAWNELSEGGWIVPTREEGILRLLRLRSALNVTRDIGDVKLRWPTNADAYSCDIDHSSQAHSSNLACASVRNEEWPCPPGTIKVRDRLTDARNESESSIRARHWIERECKPSSR